MGSFKEDKKLEKLNPVCFVYPEGWIEEGRMIFSEKFHHGKRTSCGLAKSHKLVANP